MLFSFDDFPAFPRRKKIATKKEKCFHFRSSRATHGMVVKNRKLFSYPWLAACVRLGLMQKKLLLSIDCSLFQLPMIQLRDEKKYQIRRPNRKICNLFFLACNFVPFLIYLFFCVIKNAMHHEIPTFFHFLELLAQLFRFIRLDL